MEIMWEVESILGLIDNYVNLDCCYTELKEALEMSYWVEND